MKVGDIVKLINLDDSWGKVGLIVDIKKTNYGTGQIYFISQGTGKAVPWHRRSDFMKVISY